MCSLNVQHGLLSLGVFQRGKRVGLFSALPVDSSWSCGKWGLRPAREVGTQASPGAEPTSWAWLAVLPRCGPSDGQERACRFNAMATTGLREGH